MAGAGVASAAALACIGHPAGGDPEAGMTAGCDAGIDCCCCIGCEVLWPIAGGGFWREVVEVVESEALVSKFGL